MSAPRRGREAGFSLVQAVAVTAVMLVLMSVGMPSWRYVMQDAREEELLFRGGQIADAVARYQKKHGNALPASLDVLVKGRFLRKAYKDPMTKDGTWRFVRAGEVQLPGAGGQRPGAPVPGGGSRPGASPGPSPSPSASPATQPPGGNTTGSTGGGLGGFIGVASTSTAKSLRVFNGKTKYNEWVFAAGQQRMVGNTPLTGLVPGAAPGVPQPGAPGAPSGPVRE